MPAPPPHTQSWRHSRRWQRPFGSDLSDWGGAIVWRVAMWYPEVIEKLVVMAGPHPNLFMSNMDADQKRRCAIAQYNSTSPGLTVSVDGQ